MEETGMARVTKDTTIGEVIQIDAGVIPILMGAGMHCVGCAGMATVSSFSASGENKAAPDAGSVSVGTG